MCIYHIIFIVYGIFSYIYHPFKEHVGKNASLLEHMGYVCLSITIITHLTVVSFIDGQSTYLYPIPQKQGLITPPKFNIAPEKWWLGDYFPFGKITFHGLCWTSGG